MKATRLCIVPVFLALCLSFLIPCRVFSAPFFSTELQTGLLYSYTKLPDLAGAIQSGYGGRLNLTLATCDVYAEANGAYSGNPAHGPSLIGAFQADLFSFDQSMPFSDGNLYRAWWGFGAGLLGGIRTAPFMTPIGRKASLKLEAGAGLRATKYTGTGLVSANPALLAQTTLELPLPKGRVLGLSIPVEFAWKSGGTVFIFGISGVFGSS